ncbi:MAG: dihydroorotate dehydrogenase (quinone), partial [Bacteroidota bacterium]
MYKGLIRPLLFLLPPERAHYFTFDLLRILHLVPGMGSLFRWLFSYRNDRLERELFGLKFPNPVGLAAGFDKDARLIDEMSNLGFGFIEIGTITPKGQPGNPQPRLFRLPLDQSLINRMGFNNGGAVEAVERLKKRKSNVIVGGNIGKNKITPNDEAEKDYLTCFRKLFDYVDY